MTARRLRAEDAEQMRRSLAIAPQLPADVLATVVAECERLLAERR